MMLTPVAISLRDLPPGSRFRLPHTGRTGLLLMVNDCRARVRYTDDKTAIDITPNCAVAVQEEGE